MRGSGLECAAAIVVVNKAGVCVGGVVVLLRVSGLMVVRVEQAASGLSLVVGANRAFLFRSVVVVVAFCADAVDSVMASVKAFLVVTGQATVLVVVVMVVVDALIEASHSATKVVCSVERSTTVGFFVTPAGSTREDCCFESTSAGFARTIGEWLLLC